jgi:hypothetical protein
LKNLSYLILTAFFGLLVTYSSSAQMNPPQVRKCGTRERVDIMFKRNPKLKLLATQPSQAYNTPSRTNTAKLTAVVSIPVVVHIVLPNPYLVTDADVMAQIDRLNLDFSGLNPDSTNVPTAFTALRGHSQIRFCLAKRTPDGKLTSGIERRSSTTGFDIDATKDPIKYTADGGLDAWDPSLYLNYWIGVDGTAGGVLGYSQFPGSTIDSPLSDGVVINYQAWGTSSCYTGSSFNLGRTAVHETGHYFGLLHTWGDDGNTCTGDDFAALSTAGSSCTLPTTLYNPDGQGNTASDIGDTPNQSGEMNGCPSTMIVTDSCSKTGPGIMYQNMMDYSNDLCLTMFTKKQVERMEYVLMNCRSGLTTSQGCQYPASPVSLDAAPIQSVNPGGFETNNCNTTFYSSVLICPGNVIPKVRIQNNGLTTITTLTVGYRLNNGTPVSQTFTVNLSLGQSTVVSFAAAPVVSGTNTFTFFTAKPNGQADQVPANDSLRQTLQVQTTAPLPAIVDFESATFPPPGWAIDNYNGDVTWERKSPGKNSSFSMFMNNYDVDATNNLDDFKSPRLTTTGYDSVVISFDLAHKYYPQEDFFDSLSVLVTKDCGASYQTVYNKGGQALATAGSSNDPYDTPAPEDWRTERIVLSGNIIAGGEISVVFRNTSKYGNNIFIDNINITGKKAAPSFRDLTVSNIISPGIINCSSSVTPQVVVSNVGVDVITSFKVGYQVGNATPVIQTYNQAIAPNGSVTLTLAPVSSLSGTNVFTVFTADPVSTAGTGDNQLNNDTLMRALTVLQSVQGPLTEGFESTLFPPTSWSVNNPDNGTTWQRSNTGYQSSGSAYVNTFRYTSTGQVDELISPVINYNNSDSVYLSFDVAAAMRSASITDTLTVLLTKDCGASFFTIYKKWGNELKTVSANLTTEFIPTGSDWRRERIDLAGLANQGPVVLIFRVTNKNGNNVYIDNINLATQSYPPILVRRGYLILPTAFRDNFRIMHYQQPVTLKYVNVYNALGQLIQSKQYNGNAERTINIDLSGRAGGSYLVRLGYEDESKNVSQWVIKY